MGIDSDNGSEFINDQLLSYCKKQQISFTRSRPHNKNDSRYVEQRNWSIVRKAVGYYRYDNQETLKILNKLYDVYRLYTNFFLPNMKLMEKERIGNKMKEKYDTPKTPYQRVLESSLEPKEKKEQLKLLNEELNPFNLLRQIQKLQRSLIKLSTPYNTDINKQE